MFKEIKANKSSISGRKLIYGKGINDADYITQPTIHSKMGRCPYYVVWASVVERCCSVAFQKKRPTYKGCIMCQEWLVFSNFKKWMVNQDWQDKQIDKDLLFPGNKIYSPSTCVFVSSAINSLLCDCRASRGQWPQGVCRPKGRNRFNAQCRIDGANRHLGCFDTAEEASAAYNIFKEREITRLAYLQTDERVRNGLLLHAKIRAAA